VNKTARTTLRFTCTGCGDCCTGDPKDYWVETTLAERQRIAKYLGISMQWLRRRYLVREEDSTGIGMQGGRCTFLEGNRCRIYAVRPTQCRTYPLWPELLTSNAAWKAEARRCEGIGRGAIIPLAKIRKALTQTG
jgi:Fe-S-cluster containining protein